MRSAYNFLAEEQTEHSVKEREIEADDKKEWKFHCKECSFKTDHSGHYKYVISEIFASVVNVLNVVNASSYRSNTKC